VTVCDELMNFLYQRISNPLNGRLRPEDRRIERLLLATLIQQLGISGEVYELSLHVMRIGSDRTRTASDVFEGKSNQTIFPAKSRGVCFFRVLPGSFSADRLKSARPPPFEFASCCETGLSVTDADGFGEPGCDQISRILAGRCLSSIPGCSIKSARLYRDIQSDSHYFSTAGLPEHPAPPRRRRPFQNV
jgi:hypothetical protein